MLNVFWRVPLIDFTFWPHHIQCIWNYVHGNDLIYRTLYIHEWAISLYVENCDESENCTAIQFLFWKSIQTGLTVWCVMSFAKCRHKNCNAIGAIDTVLKAILEVINQLAFYDWLSLFSLIFVCAILQSYLLFLQWSSPSAKEWCWIALKINCILSASRTFPHCHWN